MRRRSIRARLFVTDLHQSLPADRAGIPVRRLQRCRYFLTVLTGALSAAAPTVTATTSTAGLNNAADASKLSLKTTASRCLPFVNATKGPHATLRSSILSGPGGGRRLGYLGCRLHRERSSCTSLPHPCHIKSSNNSHVIQRRTGVRLEMSGTQDDDGGDESSMPWSVISPLKLLDVDPAALTSPYAGTFLERSRPRMAKTTEYAESVQSAWRDEVSDRERSLGGSRRLRTVASAPITYEDDDLGNDGLLHGYVVMNTRRAGDPPKIPGIVFFHTGAGPQDLYLHWRAHSLASDVETFPHGCIILIADVIGDERGWGWDDEKSRYESYRKRLLAVDGKDGSRPKLRSKVRAAVDTLRELEGVDGTNVAAMGWCLGGQCVAELIRMEIDGMRAAVSFHGFFDGIVDVMSAVERKTKRAKNDGGEQPAKDDETTTGPHLLLCHGRDDPYVTPEDLLAVRGIADSVGARTALIEFDGARHGFTNPAQRFNPNPKFGYDAVAADVSWQSARGLLRSCLSKKRVEEGRQDGA